MYQVGTTQGLTVGQWVRINLDDPGDGSLIVDMNGGQNGFGPNQKGAKNVIRHLSRISQMNATWVRYSSFFLSVI